MTALFRRVWMGTWRISLGSWMLAGGLTAADGKTNAVVKSGGVGASVGQGAGVNYPFYNKDGRLEANLRGASVEPIGGNQLRFHQLHIETFNEDGTPNLVGEAPDCVYSLATKTVSSSGPLLVIQSSGTFRVSGEGFLWEQITGRLVISNQAHTVFRLADSAFSRP
jgi:hypothetical protein